MPLFSESDWIKVGGGGGGISVGPRALGKISIDVTGGRISVKKDSDDRIINLHYGGVGASLGGSVIPSLVNFAMDMPSRPSSDRIYKTYRSGRNLEYNEMKGTFLMLSAGVDLTVGYSLAGMFIGGLIPPSPSSASSLLFFMGTAKAFIPMSGPTATMLPGNIGAGYVIGRIQ